MVIWKWSRTSWLRACAISGVAVLAVACSNRPTEVSEIDSYERAVTTQSAQDALAFISNFPSSHLVGDLIDSLPPAAALQTCVGVRDRVGAAKSCQRLREMMATKPLVPSAPLEISATASADEAGTFVPNATSQVVPAVDKSISVKSKASAGTASVPTHKQTVTQTHNAGTQIASIDVPVQIPETTWRVEYHHDGGGNSGDHGGGTGRGGDGHR